MRRIKDQQRSFVDLELERQGVRMEAALQLISQFLDRRPDLLELVRRDLVGGLKKPRRGRQGMTAEQVLRTVVLKRIKNWSFRELRERIAAGITLRQFTRFQGAPVPKHKALHAASVRLRPQTLRRINDIVIEVAMALGIEDAQSVRMDTTVVETDIHFPTDSMLLWDCVRVLTRNATRIFEDLPRLPARFANRTRAARRRMQEIHRLTPQQRKDQQVGKYRELIKVTQQVVDTARAVAKAAPGAAAKKLDVLGMLRVDALCAEIKRYAGLADRVLTQSRRRVLEGEQVPAHEKLYSIFEPHTDLIKRGKANKPLEFGHKVFLAETRRGLILDYWVIAGNPTDDVHVKPWLQRHCERFAAAPHLCAGDRGFYSRDNVAAVRAGGVHIEALPQRGGHKSAQRQAHENSRTFKRAQRFRAGIEGRISVLMRGRGLRRCLLAGEERFDLFLATVVLANNLLVIAAHLQKRTARRRAA
jgi:IS5 family transposase